MTPEPAESIDDLEEPINHFLVAGALRAALQSHSADPVALFGIQRREPGPSGHQVIAVQQIEGVADLYRAYEHRAEVAVSIEEFVYHLVRANAKVTRTRGLVGIALQFASTTIPVHLRPSRGKPHPAPEPITLDNAVFGHPDATRVEEAWAICLDGMSHHVSWSDPEELTRRPRWDVVPPMGFVKGQLMLRTDLFNLLHLLAGIPVEDRIEE